MHLDIALLADAATVDAAGKLNVLGAFHRLRGPEFPLRHGRLALVLRFAPDADDPQRMSVEIRMVGPDDDVILRLDGQVEGRGGPDPAELRIPQVVNMDGIVFPAEGTYRFQVAVDGELIGEIPLRVEEGGRTPGGRGRPGPGPEGGGPTPVIVPPGSEGGVKA
jgi:hypothetical protein